jgi:hypothetical protein
MSGQNLCQSQYLDKGGVYIYRKLFRTTHPAERGPRDSSRSDSSMSGSRIQGEGGGGAKDGGGGGAGVVQAT